MLCMHQGNKPVFLSGRGVVNLLVIAVCSSVLQSLITELSHEACAQVASQIHGPFPPVLPFASVT